eukprot:1419711-Amphidinium_carterae.3
MGFEDEVGHSHSLFVLVVLTIVRGVGCSPAANGDMDCDISVWSRFEDFFELTGHIQPGVSSGHILTSIHSRELRSAIRTRRRVQRHNIGALLACACRVLRSARAGTI